MKTYNIFIFDDNAVFLSAFKKELVQYLDTLPQSFSVYACSNIAAIEKNVGLIKPDLIIADIKLSEDGKNGIDYIRGLQSNGCKAEVIFLTGYLSYATDVFGVHPLYFILKSEYRQRIAEAIDIFLKAAEHKQAVITLTTGKITEIVPTNTIMYIERVMRKTIVHCENRVLNITMPLGDIAPYLPAKAFAFSHQSVIVNLAFVKSFGNSTVSMSNGEELPVSRSHSDDFSHAMSEYLCNSI